MAPSMATGMASIATLAAVCYLRLFVSTAEQETHNPLERINVASVVFQVDNAIQLTVNSTSLPAGQSHAWFEVAWTGVSHPSYADWIGLVFLAGANFTEIAPAKYKIAALDKGHIIRGEGKLSFRLINYRKAMQFALFRGGMMKPVLAALSPVIQVQNPNEPLQRHLALTGDNTQMLVQWVTHNSSKPIAKWGPAPDQLTSTTPATSISYSREEMCGPPAATIGYSDPGLFHSALLTGLEPEQQYYYSVGDERWGFSPVASFRAAPPVGPLTHVKVVAVADLGQGELDGSMEQSEMVPSLNTTALMLKDIKEQGYQLLVHNGDISYARGYVTQWDNFMHQLEPLISQVPYMASPGNHERDWPNSGDRFVDVYDSGGECGIAFERRVQMPQAGPDKPWYSFDFGPIHFLQYSTEHAFNPGSEQHAWVLSDLAAVNRSRTPWVVVGGHRPIYISSNNIMPGDGDQPVAAALREAFEDAFIKYKVDLTLHGHHHSYQRTCPIHKGLCMGFDQQGSAGRPVHLVIGNAGYMIDPPGLFPAPIWKVDLTLHGHHHSYQRTCPVHNSNCQPPAASSSSAVSGMLMSVRSFIHRWLGISWGSSSSSSSGSTQHAVIISPNAPVHLVIGNGGAELSLNVKMQPSNIWQVIKLWWGYLRMDATGTELKCEAISDMDGSVMDSFTLNKPAGWGDKYMQQRPQDSGQSAIQQERLQEDQHQQQQQPNGCSGQRSCSGGRQKMVAE